MTLDEAVAAVEASLDSAHLRVDRKRAREDAASYLLLVLDTSGGRRNDGPVTNGPRLVDKETGTVTRVTVPDALARAERMTFVPFLSDEDRGMVVPETSEDGAVSRSTWFWLVAAGVVIVVLLVVVVLYGGGTGPNTGGGY